MKKYFAVTAVCLILLSGCAKSKIVNNPDVPYESLGSLEVKVPREYSTLKYLTLGLMRKRSSEAMTRKLDKSLTKLARSRYGADAVANVTYWPDLDSSADTEYFYARGEMIRFKKFPVLDSSHQSSESQPQSIS